MPGPNLHKSDQSGSSGDTSQATRAPPGIDPADPAIYTGSVRRQAQHLEARIAANTAQNKSPESPTTAAPHSERKHVIRTENPWATDETLRTPPVQTEQPKEPEIRAKTKRKTTRVA